MKKLFCTLACALLLITPSLADNETVIAPSGITPAENGTYLVTDTYNHAIWQFDADGTYTKIAGRTGVTGANNIPIGAYHDDSDALLSAFNTPWDIAPFADGYAISDSQNNVIRYLNNGSVTTLAGNGTQGSTNATGISASFNRPTGIVADEKGGLYVADSDNHLIRYIDNTGNVTTYAGSVEGMADGSLTSAKFSDPTGLAYANGVLYVADTGNHRICKIENGTVTTLVGGTDGFSDGIGDNATLSSPTGVYVKNDIIYISDSGNSAVRYLIGDVLSTLITASDTELFPINPRGLISDDQNLWICDVFSHTLSSITNTAQLFTDVNSSDWYADAIYEMKSYGYMNGTTTTTFEPDSNMTRAMFAQVLYNMYDATPVNYILPFTDVSDMWYTEAVRWASSEGIVNGTSDTTFSPDSLITREQMIVMLYRYATLLDLDLSIDSSITLDDFADSDTVSGYAVNSMEWAYSNDVINGTNTGALVPLNQATRAEAATILMNFLNID
ncbi:MAG: S-layer homology domain-containing protein [Clostridia bacterium]